MSSVNRVYAARLAGLVVLGPDGESLGRVRDVVISISIVRQQPRVLGLVIELLSRRRIFVPILRVTAIEPQAVTLITANLSLRRFAQRPGEVLVSARCSIPASASTTPSCRSYRASTW
jgi:Mg/Co/Ni transporter MgtE